MSHSVIATCRSCGAPGLETILELGEMPLADALLDAGDLDRPEPRYPLTVACCPGCSLVQILEDVPPEVLFGEDYPYYSSFSDALVDYARRNAKAMLASRDLGPDSLVVELASNDGYLLRHFAEAGVGVLGVDPAPGPARAAEEAGIPTLCTFFDRELATRLAGEGRRADVVVANNVLAHVPDQNEFVAGIATLLADHGVAVIEVPYVRDLIEGCEFDTIYHEHRCYFSVTTLVALFARHGLHPTDVEHLPIHGGSLRLFAEHHPRPAPAVQAYLAEEDTRGLNGPAYHRDFAARVADVHRRLRDLLGGLKAKGHRLAAYGAAAKGTTLLNFTGIGTETLDFVVDRNTHKQGRYMPGVHLPIRPPQALLEDRPDEVLLLAWNFAEEIIAQQQAYLDGGGRFIVPVPRPEIL